MVQMISYLKLINICLHHLRPLWIFQGLCSIRALGQDAFLASHRHPWATYWTFSPTLFYRCTLNQWQWSDPSAVAAEVAKACRASSSWSLLLFWDLFCAADHLRPHHRTCRTHLRTQHHTLPTPFPYAFTSLAILSQLDRALAFLFPSLAGFIHWFFSCLLLKRSCPIALTPMTNCSCFKIIVASGYRNWPLNYCFSHLKAKMNWVEDWRLDHTGWLSRIATVVAIAFNRLNYSTDNS